MFIGQMSMFVFALFCLLFSREQTLHISKQLFSVVPLLTGWCICFIAGWYMPCIPDTAERRDKRGEHCGVHVWWHCQYCTQPKAGGYHQPPRGRRCLCWCSEGTSLWIVLLSFFSHLEETLGSLCTQTFPPFNEFPPVEALTRILHSPLDGDNKNTLGLLHLKLLMTVLHRPWIQHIIS